MANDVSVIERGETDNSASIKAAAILTLGLGCLIALLRMFSVGFAGYLGGDFAISSDPFYASRAVSSILVLAALAFAGYKKAYKPGVGLLLVAALGMTGAIILFAVESQGADHFGLSNALLLGSFASVLGGASIAVLLYVWMMLLSSYRVKRIALVVALAFVLSELLVAVATVAPDELVLVVALLCSFFSGMNAFSLDPDLATCSADGPFTKKERTQIPLASVIMTVAICMLSAMLYAIVQWRYYDVSSMANHPVQGVAIVACLALTLLIMGVSKSWWHFVWLPEFALLALTVLFALFAHTLVDVTLGLLIASQVASLYVLWLAVPAMVSKAKVPHAVLVAVVLLLGCTTLSVSIGAQLALVLSHGSQPIAGAAGAIAIGVAIVLAVVVVMQGVFVSGERAATATAATATAAAPSDAALGAAQAAALAQASGISGEGAAASSPTDTPVAATDTTQEAAAPTQASAEQAGSAQTANANAKPNASAAAELARATAAAAAPVAAPAPAPEPAPAKEADESPYEQMKSRIDQIGEEYKLTARETEIALLTAQGFSCAYIADKLVVSNSTVRYHQQNGYRKLGIHSRNELIEFVNAYVPKKQ